MNRQSKEYLRSIRKTFEDSTGTKWTGDERSWFRAVNAIEHSMFKNAARLGMVHKDRLSDGNTGLAADQAPAPVR